jgi:transcription antitermination factor NusG
MQAQDIDMPAEMCQDNRTFCDTDGSKPPFCFQPCGQRAALPWYCVRVAPQAEKLARDTLLDVGLTVWLPMEERQRSNRQWISRPLFPAYMFMQFDYSADDWRIAWARAKANHRLRLELLGLSRSAPTPLPRAAMDSLFKQCDADGVIRPKPPQPADRLGITYRVTRGPFALFIGVCSMSETDRVCLLLTLFGRDMPTWLHVDDVEQV